MLVETSSGLGSLRPGECFCSVSSSNPHYHDVCILKWFKLGDETEVEAALPNAHCKTHQVFMSDVQHLQFCFTDLLLICGTICQCSLGQLYTSENLLATCYTDCGKEDYHAHKTLPLTPSGQSVLQKVS